MDEEFAVFLTDGVNRRRELLPLSTIVKAMERDAQSCLETGLQLGMPLNLSHDRCRPCGWSRATGVHLARDYARQIGVLLQPTTDDEAKAIQLVRDAFDARAEADRVRPYAEALAARVPGKAEPCGLLEAAALRRTGLAADLYPAFFDPKGGLVDKDGLVNYGALLAQTRRVQAGVFHDPDRDLVIFAHPFFRRSLSRMNALNGYVLDTFHRIATDNRDLTARLRLDPDVVGHPGSVRPFVELEYWRGPRFSDDLAAIPDGVAEHKATPAERRHAAVDKTQIWWKVPEGRRDEGRGLYEVRTFEVEELVENPSHGLGENRFGCRYAHAEYDLERGHISHFDGAVRAYAADAYLARLDVAIDRAGKQADYTKLFRVDGPLAITDWKRLLSDHYRGNHLIPEYLGAPADVATDEDPPRPRRKGKAKVPALAALITIDLHDGKSLQAPPRVVANYTQVFGDVIAPVAEIGLGAIADLLGGWTDNEHTCHFRAEGGAHNLSTIHLGSGEGVADRWRDAATRLAAALEATISVGAVHRLSLAVRWTLDGLEVTLSFAGEARRLGRLLSDAVMIVRPDLEPSTWSEDLHAALRREAPPLTGPVAWTSAAVTSGRLTVDEGGKLRGSIWLPIPLRGLARTQLSGP